MKILISDYMTTLRRNVSYEINYLKKLIPEADIEIYEYNDEKKHEFIEKLKESDGLITAFIKLDSDILCQVNHRLKCISVNATGYNNVDLKAAMYHHIHVSHVYEYCTKEVAEHTIAVLMSLSRMLKHYQYDIEKRKVWSYTTTKDVHRVEGSTLAIFGFGKIGQAVSVRAIALGMHVIAVDPFLPEEIAKNKGVELVSADEALERADYISNHMNQSVDNKKYFSRQLFEKMKRNPVFLNMARGEAVDEEALKWALDNKKIRGVALDMLTTENPDLEENTLLHRDNVVITPHSAFYSAESLKELQQISCENIVNMLCGKNDNVQKLLV